MSVISHLTGHAEILGLVSLKATLGARQRLAAFVLETFAAYVILTIASLAAKTRVLPVPIAALALVRLRLKDLTRGLMFELIVLTEMASAERALKTAPTVVPNASFAFCANCILERASATVNAQALSPMTNPCLTMVTYSTLHLR